MFTPLYGPAGSQLWLQIGMCKRANVTTFEIRNACFRFSGHRLAELSSLLCHILLLMVLGLQWAYTKCCGHYTTTSLTRPVTILALFTPAPSHTGCLLTLTEVQWCEQPDQSCHAAVPGRQSNPKLLDRKSDSLYRYVIQSRNSIGGIRASDGLRWAAGDARAPLVAEMCGL